MKCDGCQGRRGPCCPTISLHPSKKGALASSSPKGGADLQVYPPSGGRLLRRAGVGRMREEMRGRRLVCPGAWLKS